MKERYRVTGMTCSACSSHVEKSVNKLEGIERASVNLLTETMDVTYDETILGSAEIIAAVEKAGYGAARYSIQEGSTREESAGEGGIEENRREMPSGGYSNAVNDKADLQRKMDKEAKAMRLRLGISIGFLIPLMYVAMYHMLQEWFGLPIPEFIMKAFHGNENAMNFALTQFLLLLPILYMNRKFFSVGFKTLAHRSPNMDSLIALGAGAATVYGIFAMYRISYGLGHGDMALVEHYSHDLYFESAGTILTLITVGKYLESRSKGKTSEAITKLMNLAPKVAVVLTEEGEEKEIPTELLQKGDIFLVKPGSTVPVDGTVLEGTSSVDEAAITGESVPVEKREGDKVVSATMNKAGFLKCRADRVGDDTTLSQIIRLVEEASASKAPIAQLADKVAGIFVPTVICISILTLFGWLIAGADAEFAISTAIAVLVISCPCALGLATPVAIMVGTGVGANNGILIKSGEALQQAKEIDTVVLDKTGTITEGKLKVMQVKVFDTDAGEECEAPKVQKTKAECGGLVIQETIREQKTAFSTEQQQLLTLAAALESRSEHPLAEAVVNAAKEITDATGAAANAAKAESDTAGAVIHETKEAVTASNVDQKSQLLDFQQVTVSDFTAVFGRGIEGRLSAGWLPEGRYFVGNQAYMEEQQIVLPGMAQAVADSMADEGQTPLFVADEQTVLGIIGVADTLKESSEEAIADWLNMGVNVIMLTGDNKRTAEAVRRKLNLTEVIAEVLPQDKERKISELKAAGHKVAMIGDGINDAPALAAADVGMAIGAGTDVAMESADIILMKSDLRDAVTAMELSRAVIRNIKQNLFWAFFYNSIGIPLAAGLLYPAFQIRLSPMFGAAAMSLSSIFVVGNALRLRRTFEKRKKEEEEWDALKRNLEEQRAALKKREAEEKQAAEEKQKALEKQAAEEKQAAREKQVTQEKQTANFKETTQITTEGRTTTMTKVMTIEGMMCAHCTGRVQKALEAIEGVSQVEMSLENKTATLKLEASVADEALTAAVTDAGYEVKAIESR